MPLSSPDSTPVSVSDATWAPAAGGDTGWAPTGIVADLFFLSFSLFFVSAAANITCQNLFTNVFTKNTMDPGYKKPFYKNTRSQSMRILALTAFLFKHTSRKFDYEKNRSADVDYIRDPL